MRIVLWAGCIAAALWAQRGGEPGRGGIDHFVSFLSDTLRLDPDQRKSLEKILTTHREKARSIRGSTTEPAQRQAQLRALRMETDAQIEALLTPSQKESWESIKQDWRRRARARYEKRTGKRLPPEED